ncbi:MAG TPA: TVP38/TMEM64 family protein [Candidatus Polarisedimenticolia bacterium]|nr:TVP38/TMEM64 family protein [Candidatus Polarisedimenticolia bacterium]
MKSWKMKALLVAALVVAAIVLLRVLQFQGTLERSVRWASGTGTPGLVIFSFIYMGAAVLFLPGSVLTLLAGALFGLKRGTLAVSAGATLGAAASFLIARYLARDRVARWAAENPRFASLDAAVGKEGWKIVFLTRLSPIFPYNLLNYLFGLTKVGFWPYLLASWVGMLPGTILYVYLGFAGRAVAANASGPEVGNLWEGVFWGVGLAATALLTFYVARLARRALREQTR